MVFFGLPLLILLVLLLIFLAGRNSDKRQNGDRDGRD